MVDVPHPTGFVGSEMMANDRFDHLEPVILPASVREAISRLDRFGHLELGKTDTPTPVPTPAAPSRLLCPHCHQSNETVRDYCWACFHPLRPVAPGPNQPADEQEIQLLLDGVSYKSSDPALPEDVKALMERIRSQGFSQQLLSDWKAWKKRGGSTKVATPVEAPSPGTCAPDPSVEAFQGARVSILRLDGVLYKSDDENLPPDIKEILDYIERDGVTPALMQHLRLYGTKVKFRPLSAVYPSDGDVDFWKTAKKLIDR